MNFGTWHRERAHGLAPGGVEVDVWVFAGQLAADLLRGRSGAR